MTYSLIEPSAGRLVDIDENPDIFSRAVKLLSDKPGRMLLASNTMTRAAYQHLKDNIQIVLDDRPDPDNVHKL